MVKEVPDVMHVRSDPSLGVETSRRNKDCLTQMVRLAVRLCSNNIHRQRHPAHRVADVRDFDELSYFGV